MSVSGRAGSTCPARSRRVASHRTALLASGTLSVADLAKRRGTDLHRTRLWLAHRAGDGGLFTVTHHSTVLVPQFQLTSDGDARRELRPVLQVLLEARLPAFALWTWMVAPHSALADTTPADLAGFAPLRVLHAAQQFAWSQPRV